MKAEILDINSLKKCHISSTYIEFIQKMIFLYMLHSKYQSFWYIRDDTILSRQTTSKYTKSRRDFNSRFQTIISTYTITETDNSEQKATHVPSEKQHFFQHQDGTRALVQRIFHLEYINSTVYSTTLHLYETPIKSHRILFYARKRPIWFEKCLA